MVKSSDEWDSRPEEPLVSTPPPPAAPGTSPMLIDSASPKSSSSTSSSRVLPRLFDGNRLLSRDRTSNAEVAAIGPSKDCHYRGSILVYPRNEARVIPSSSDKSASACWTRTDSLLLSKTLY
ncbi:unnamed protein product [Oikopleura dioica]|uniref:Uncharacterized protein n=1 Tax=Oikopleura dioica TaxID=34765 RepID=E4Z444_OIKDI|nr:unnamed protein product [Oikopleura dioica]